MAEYMDIVRIDDWDNLSIIDDNGYAINVYDVGELPRADVVEREKIDKAIEEIEQTLYVDSLIFGELIDFKDGKNSADDVIEEFNRVTRKEVLEILDKLIESEAMK